MDDATELEKALMRKLLDGVHPTLGVLRAQAATAHVSSREDTGAGFYVTFDVPADVPFLSALDFRLDDVSAAIDGLRYGAGFILFIKRGRIHALEGYSFEEPWPRSISGARLSYVREPRDLSHLPAFKA